MKDRKEKKRWGLILFIVIIMVGTSASFVLIGSQQNEVAKYNGIKFVSQNSVWIAKISGKDAAFSFLPGDVESIRLSGESAQKLKGRLEIDVTYDLNSTYREPIALAQHQMGLTLGQYNIFNLPIITCNDATSIVPVVYFRQGNATSINAEGDCIIAEASSGEGFIKAKDRILYGVLGVIK